MPKGRPVFISREDLIDLYVGKKLSTIQIARQYGIDNEAIRKKLVGYDIPRRTKSEAQKIKIMTPEHLAKLKEGAKKVNLGKVGSLNHRWKGGRHIDSYGYAVLRINKKYVKEHRYFMEQYLGRNLESWEWIHHINGNKLDNRLKNLQVIENVHAKLDYERRLATKV